MERERQQRDTGSGYSAHRTEHGATARVLGQEPRCLRGYDEEGEVVGRQGKARYDCPPRQLATAWAPPCQLERQHR